MKRIDTHSLVAHWRYLVAATAVALAFVLAYAAAGYVTPGGGSTANAAGNSTQSSRGGGCAMGAMSGGGCGGATSPGAAVSAAAVEDGGVQRLSVAVGAAGYTPNVLQLEAGVPTEITFSQSSGCTARVLSDDLGFDVDLTAGPQTVRLSALQPGTYAFSCGMRMVDGSIVVSTSQGSP